MYKRINRFGPSSVARHILPLAAAAVCLLTTNLCYGVSSYLEDHFLDGSLANGTNAGENDTTWFAINSNAAGTPWTATTNNNAPLSLTGMHNGGSSAQNTIMLGAFSGGALTLTNPGDSIVLTFDCQFNFTSKPTGGALQIYLGNDNGTPTTSNEIGTATNSGDDQKIASATINNVPNFQTTGTHSVSFTLMLADNGTSLLRTTTLDGIATDSSTVALPTTLSFNEVGLAWSVSGGSSTSEQIDNIIVSVPEPTSLAAVAICSSFVLLRPRYQRKHSLP